MSAGLCTHPDCQRRQGRDRCLGNRLVKVGEPEPRVFAPAGAGAATTEPVTRFRLVAPHHKSVRHHGRQLEFNLPYELNLLLHIHLSYGLAKVLGSSGGSSSGGTAAADSYPFVFCWATTKKQMLAQQASQLWSRVVLPQSYSFGPQTARSAFVTGMRDPSLPAAGFTATAAAEAMGHSHQMWEAVYDKMQREHAVQQSVDRMAAYRKKLVQQWERDLAAAAAREQQQQPPPEPESGGSSGDESE